MDVRIGERNFRARVRGLDTGVRGGRFPIEKDGDTGLPKERSAPDGGGAWAGAPRECLRSTVALLQEPWGNRGQRTTQS